VLERREDLTTANARSSLVKQAVHEGATGTIMRTVTIGYRDSVSSSPPRTPPRKRCKIKDHEVCKPVHFRLQHHKVSQHHLAFES
jgi:hypothetical protein